MTDYLVEVCSSCRTASCWHGEFMCQHSQVAGTVFVRSSLLAQEDREHPSNFSVEKLELVCGTVRYVQ